jgi:uncharacterized membrane protein
MKKLLPLLSLLLSGTAAALDYQITALEGLDPGGSSLAYGMNDSGQVVGQAFNSTSGLNEAVVWDNGVALSLGHEGLARSVNNSGTVVGETGNANLFLPSGEAFIYENGVFSILNTGMGPNSGAYDINDSGIITGYAFFGVPFTTQAHGFIYDNGVTTEIDPYTNAGGYSRGHGINEAGSIAGRSSEDLFNNSDKHMSVWDSTGQINFQPAPYTYSTAQQINNNGVVVGNGHDANGDMKAIIWNTDGSIQLLGTFGGTQSRAFSINDANTIVGFAEIAGNDDRAMISYDGLNMVDLNSEVANLSGWASLDRAYDINENGDIVGYGTRTDGTQQAFRLTVVPVPAAIWMFISALGLLASRRALRNS